MDRHTETHGRLRIPGALVISGSQGDFEGVMESAPA